MRYDKTGTGWGRGDALWACDAKHGNCTDFHSPFIGMMRADDVPRASTSLPVPETKTRATLPAITAGPNSLPAALAGSVGHLRGMEGQRKGRLFLGSVDSNRVQFSTGRDITLSPKQDGPPLNYFVYPYVEVDGKTYESIGRKFSFAKSASRIRPTSARIPRRQCEEIELEVEGEFADKQFEADIFIDAVDIDGPAA